MAGDRSEPVNFDAIIVGAGVGGLYAIYRLRKLGLKLRVFEAGGVIGTGSSGVQSIPIIAKQAKHLYVFQRTANFSLPARNAPMDAAKERTHKAEYPERRRAAFDTPFGIAGYPAPVTSALDATEEERRRAYE